MIVNDLALRRPLTAGLPHLRQTDALDLFLHARCRRWAGAGLSLKKERCRSADRFRRPRQQFFSGATDPANVSKFRKIAARLRCEDGGPQVLARPIRIEIRTRAIQRKFAAACQAN